jgi:hypothetical protein
VDNSVDYSRNNLAVGGSHIVPAQVVTDRLAVLENLRQWLSAEMQFASDVLSLGDDVLPSNVRGSLASQTLLPAPQLVQKTKVITKSIIFHALSALACSPRVDIRSYLNFDIRNYIHVDRQAPGNNEHEDWYLVVDRLRNWLDVGRSSAWGNGQLKDAARDSVAMADSHVCALAGLLQELLPHSAHLTFVRQFIVWCVLSTATIDLVRLSLGNAAEHAEARARSVVFGRFFQDRAVLESWPSHTVVGATYNFFLIQAFVFRGALIVS